MHKLIHIKHFSIPDAEAHLQLILILPGMKHVHPMFKGKLQIFSDRLQTAGTIHPQRNSAIPATPI